jgi:hypothetical protein
MYKHRGDGSGDAPPGSPTAGEPNQTLLTGKLRGILRELRLQRAFHRVLGVDDREIVRARHHALGRAQRVALPWVMPRPP